MVDVIGIAACGAVVLWLVEWAIAWSEAVCRSRMRSTPVSQIAVFVVAYRLSTTSFGLARCAPVAQWSTRLPRAIEQATERPRRHASRSGSVDRCEALRTRRDDGDRGRLSGVCRRHLAEHALDWSGDSVPCLGRLGRRRDRGAAPRAPTTAWSATRRRKGHPPAPVLLDQAPMSLKSPQKAGGSATSSARINSLLGSAP